MQNKNSEQDPVYQFINELYMRCQALEKSEQKK